MRHHCHAYPDIDLDNWRIMVIPFVTLCELTLELKIKDLGARFGGDLKSQCGCDETNIGKVTLSM